ncbi:MAG: hypothetical protein IJA34_05930 [Lachnospiraceae bacterium]|nr:hypothetical protein [Lachnospiraceae bacterium]
MLNENKIGLMTRLAMYEQGEGKDALKSNKYSKSDYVSLKMINTAITVTIAYFMIVSLWIIYKIDEYVADLVNLDYFNMGIKLLVIYVIVLVLYMFVTYMVYSLKYIKMQEMNKKYSDNLKDLYLLYKKEEKQKNENKLGGISSDDDSFEF